jgi:hypothetical protein
MLSSSINTTSWMQQQRKKEAIDVKKTGADQLTTIC